MHHFDDAHEISTVMFNSLAPGRFQWNFNYVIFFIILVIVGWGNSCEIADTNDKSTLFQDIAWCCQTTNHYLSQCSPSSKSLYGITRPQWVNFFAINSAVVFYNAISIDNYDSPSSCDFKSLSVFYHFNCYAVCDFIVYLTINDKTLLCESLSKSNTYISGLV